MLFKEIFIVYREKHMKHKVGYVGKVRSYWLLKEVVHIVTTPI
jgi:hypothetical protein